MIYPSADPMNRIRQLCAFLAIALVTGCSSGADVAAARTGVAQFRELMEAQQFRQIYEGASGEFRKGTQEEQFIRILTAFRGKLGSVKDTKDFALKVTYRLSGTRVELSFKTEFEKGSGIESFAYDIVQGNASFVGYRVESPELVTN